MIGLFALGLWMVSLTYYNPWYNAAPDIHRSVGILLLGVLAFRLIRRLFVPRPKSDPGHARWERISSRITHAALNWLTLLVILAGYFISSAGGEPVGVFDWFSIPAPFEGVERQEEIAGWLHKYLAWALIVLATLHAAAAVKHHVFDRDRTLMRILRPKANQRASR